MSDPDPLHPRFGEVWQHHPHDGKVMVIGPSVNDGLWLALTLDKTPAGRTPGNASRWAFTESCEDHWVRIEERETWD